MEEPVPKGKVKFSSSGTTFVVDDHYEYIKKIGHGAYGVVVAVNDKLTGNKLAIKKVTNAFEDLIDAKRIVREIRLLKFLRHENIVNLKSVLMPPSRNNYLDIYFVTELLETDLHRVIYSRQDLSDDHLQYFLYQILRGLLYMHSANVIHRDIKPSNLLLNKNCELKICDLGLARGFDDETSELTEYVVTRWYRAPEIVLNSSNYSEKVDVWSAGCVFAELLGRAPLFPGEDYLDQVKRIVGVLGTPSQEDLDFIQNPSAKRFIQKLPRRDKTKWSVIFPKAPAVALDLLDQMLSFNAEKRASVIQCLRHPYFKELHSRDDETLAEVPFDWSCDNFELTKENLQAIVYEEAKRFRGKVC
jgi:mitogen-activated protein kinase 1/3